MIRKTAAYPDIRRIGELSDKGVFIFDTSAMRFIYVNKAFLKIFGGNQKKFLEGWQLVLKFINAEDTVYLQNKYKELIETGSITSTEFRLQFENRPLKHINCDAYLVDDNKIVTGFVRDVTNAKQHEDFMIDYGARKDTLLDMITHNLSGPLHLSKHILDSVSKKIKNEKDKVIRTEIRIIRETTAQCIDIVNDFLREEHRESARIYVKKTRFNVMQRIRATVEKMKVTNPDKQFRLITKLDNLNISTDSVKFFQIIHNVLSNSIKFTRENGKIDVIVKEYKTFFVISVRDNGIGIPASFHPVVFNKKTASRRPGLKGESSSGIGLSIAKKLTEIIGGSIWFTSNENKGSTFYIKLPKE